jgi:hypothetical protein
MAAQQPAAQTGRLRGEAPDIFHGDRSKSETFKQQFKVYQGINDNHEVMQNPYYRTMQALSLIKGPLVNDWVDDQICYVFILSWCRALTCTNVSSLFVLPARLFALTGLTLDLAAISILSSYVPLCTSSLTFPYLYRLSHAYVAFLL